MCGAGVADYGVTQSDASWTKAEDLDASVQCGTAISESTRSASSGKSKTDGLLEQLRAAREAHGRLRRYLDGHGFDGVNTRRRCWSRLPWRFCYPLHVAVEHNDPDMVRLLLCFGADPRCVDWNGRTPFQAASLCNMHASHEEVIRLLSKRMGAGAQPRPTRTGAQPRPRPTSELDRFMEDLVKDPLVPRRFKAKA